MKITLLNGNPDSSGSGMDQYLNALEARLNASGHTVTNLTLRELEDRLLHRLLVLLGQNTRRVHLQG